MAHWQIWIDTGGTFTDCIARDPDGTFLKTKVLSSSALRGTIQKWIDNRTVRILQDWNAPDDFVKNFNFRLLGTNHSPVPISSFNAETSVLHLEDSISPPSYDSFEVTCDLEAPVLATRLVTGTKPGDPLPPSDLRLATTKGTNALLEHKGNPTLFLITEGFADFLKIGDQKRPDLFSLDIDKPAPLYQQVIEVQERMDATGKSIQQPKLDLLEQQLQVFDTPSKISVALCLMNSYKNATHEQQVSSLLDKLGFKHVSVSSELSPFIKILHRAQTSVVNAYLSPVLHQYIDKVKSQFSTGSFRMMTSAGGLVQANRFSPKDSLLSGPAGGVVGASTIGKQTGFKQIISFDMGGTSTDVARYSNEFEYCFQHQVGDAELAAPALSIETVAAGGGSICSFDGFKLTVGPDSAGADPGPACYGSGGPLTVTDVNLLLGRVEPDNFGIPVSKEAAEQRLTEVINQVRNHKDEQVESLHILEGFLQIANERMADAIRKISLRKGYDPRKYAIVAFGGAGAQHACAIADQLNISDIIIPSDAGLLSAYGLGHAVVEQFEEKQILQLLPEVEPMLSDQFKQLEQTAKQQLSSEGIPEEECTIRRRSVFMRLEGQESTLEINFNEDGKPGEKFREAYRNRYGHWIENRVIEVESIRVAASSAKPDFATTADIKSGEAGNPKKYKPIVFEGKEINTPVFDRRQLVANQKLTGPALVLDPYSTVVLEPGWKLEVRSNGALILSQEQQKPQSSNRTQERSQAVSLELFTNRFTSIAEEMGEMLRRTALSVNVKERMDYSCALLNNHGQLVVNAPHIPVHLGALGICVRKLKKNIEMEPGDVIVTNHPAFGGSHLPDVTVVTPVFTDNDQLLGFAASRAHHAEIGGTRPGSMPPDASTLAEEGVVIPPIYLIKNGSEQWNQIRKRLTSAEHPSRSIEENIADLQAAVAANHRGARSLLTLVETYGSEKVLHYMDALKYYAAERMKSTIKQLPKGNFKSTELLDDQTRLHSTIEVGDQHISFDFEGTDSVHPGNLNATPAIVNSVIIYLLRLLVDEPLPLNEGLLEPITIQLPEGTLLNPHFKKDPKQCPAVVGGNVETSQRLTDLLLKPFQKIACSQGTMNNVLFGNEDFGYYETIGGGTGAGPDFDGTDAVHHHMTNTAGTDPEILEQRYPVRLDRYEIRRDSGGSGRYSGGNGIRREMTFLEAVSLSLLTQHRVVEPYGLNGGKPGARGKQWIIHRNGGKEQLESIDGADLEAGDQFIILTPGGGGYGKS